MDTRDGNTAPSKETTMDALSNAREWIRTDRQSIQGDVERLGLEAAAEYQVELAEDRAASGDDRWSFTAKEMLEALRDEGMSREEPADVGARVGRAIAHDVLSEGMPREDRDRGVGWRPTHGGGDPAGDAGVGGRGASGETSVPRHARRAGGGAAVTRFCEWGHWGLTLGWAYPDGRRDPQWYVPFPCGPQGPQDGTLGSPERARWQTIARAWVDLAEVPDGARNVRSGLPV